LNKEIKKLVETCWILGLGADPDRSLNSNKITPWGIRKKIFFVTTLLGEGGKKRKKKVLCVFFYFQ